MTSFRLAFRNLVRNKRRTVLTSIALAVAMMVMVFSLGIVDGLLDQSTSNLVDYDTAHLKGFAPGYIDEDFPGLDHTLTVSGSMLDRIENRYNGCFTTARLEMPGMLIKGSEELFIRVVGVDPVRDRSVFRTLDAVTAGKTFSDGEPVVLIGDKLAKDLKIEVGDIITLLVRSAPGALNPRMLPVAGLLTTGHPRVDQFAVFVQLDLAREMALLPNDATEIAIRLESENRINKPYKQLSESFPEIEFHTWRELGQDVLSLIRIRQIGTGIVVAIMSLMAAVGVANTMIMSVHERTREIGALRAMGFTSGMVGRIFILEGLQIGIIAGLVGVLLGMGITAWIGIDGISLRAYEDVDIGMPIRDAIYPTIQAGSVTISFLLAVLLAVTASWGSARTASRGQVVRALREGKL